MSDTDTSLGIVVGPQERYGVFVVPLDVRQQLSLEIERGREDPSRNAIAFEFAEPEFHLIEPGAVRRCVVQLDARMLRQPCLHGRGLVRGQVIDDDVDRFPAIPPRGWSRNATNSAELWRGTQCPWTCPDATSSAA